MPMIKEVAFDLDKIQNSFQTLHNYLVRNDFSGYEYDDLLGSKLVRFLAFDNLYLKIIAVQIAKRSFINPRKLLGVEKLKSTKAFGFIIKGYLYYYLATWDEAVLNFVRKHLAWLIENCSKGYAGISWGNNFDFASRAGFYPKGLPTIVWTSHIAEAFDFAYSVLKDERYKEVVLQTAEFVQNSLERIEDDRGICFAYAPGIVQPIHNANLLGAVTLLRAWQYTRDAKQLSLARRSITWSCSRMNPDGSWYYGERKIMRRIDNYHTAYNLDCLVRAREIAGAELVDKKIIRSTYGFWKNNFFLENGIPKFYYNRIYPIDIQAAAQAIESLSKYSVYDPGALDLAWRVAQWTIANMQKKNGSFRYRKGSWWTNNLEAIHWGQATMTSALGCLLQYTTKSNKLPKEKKIAYA